LQERLVNSLGQIGSTGGHFFLLDQYLAPTGDFSIKDPLFEELLLSAKTEELSSLRLFTPSQTDLSYFLLVLPKEMELTLIDVLAKPLEGLERVVETIAVEDEQIGKDYVLWYFKQPSSGEFNFLLQAVALEADLLAKSKLYFYDERGELKQFVLSELLTADVNLSEVWQLLINVNYDKTAAASVSLELETIQKDPNDELRTALQKHLSAAQRAFDEGNLSFYLFYQLSLLIESLRDHLDYYFLLERFLAFHELELEF